MDPKILLWSLSIGTLFLTMNSRFAYLVSGVFIGINYREHLTPYTDPIQDYAIERAKEIKTQHFPELNIPIPKPKPKSYLEHAKEYFFK